MDTDRHGFSHALRWCRLASRYICLTQMSRISRIFARAPLVLSAKPSVGVRMVNASGVMRYLCKSVIIRGK